MEAQTKPVLPHTQLAKAIAAATEFKLLLDIQAAGSLFNPGGKGDARECNGYATAARLLSEAVADRDDGCMRPGCMFAFVMPVGDVVADHGANTPAGALDILQQVREFMLGLGFKEGNQHTGGSVNGGFFEFRFSGGGEIDEVTQLGYGKSSAVHI